MNTVINHQVDTIRMDRKEVPPLSEEDMQKAMDLMWYSESTKPEAVTYVMCKRGDRPSDVSRVMSCSRSLTYARVRNVDKKLASAEVDNGE